MVSSSPFQGGDAGSIPVGTTMKDKIIANIEKYLGEIDDHAVTLLNCDKPTVVDSSSTKEKQNNCITALNAQAYIVSNVERIKALLELLKD